MPVLKNRRYTEFENSAPMDTFRGIPLKGFPWLIDKKTLTTGNEQLVWQIEISCQNAEPSGFGRKMNLNLQGKAVLSETSIEKILRPSDSNPRVETLFERNTFRIEDAIEMSIEGHIDELGKYSTAFQVRVLQHLQLHWPLERIQQLVLNRLKLTSPGGFGHSKYDSLDKTHAPFK